MEHVNNHNNKMKSGLFFLFNLNDVFQLYKFKGVKCGLTFKNRASYI
jgi:hypothetical protein